MHRSVVLPRHPDERQPRQILKHPSDHFFPTGKFVSGAKEQFAGRKHAQDDDPNRSEQTELEQARTLVETVEAEPTEGADFSNLGPVDRKLRKDYLKLTRENIDLLEQFSTPPSDVMDHGNVSKINRYRTQSKARIQSIYFDVETEDGHEHKNIDVEDMKIDCPAMLAWFVNDKKD